MNLLVDTHAVIWFITDSGNLSSRAKELIQDENNTCWVSIASLWEMAIKYKLNRLDLRTDLKEVFEIIDNSGFVVLPILVDHILTSTTLEFHHRDPFDRLLIVQGIAENLIIVTKDEAFANYYVAVKW
jgi:PIN domain nuclease of toxin-antitoxin system